MGWGLGAAYPMLAAESLSMRRCRAQSSGFLIVPSDNYQPNESLISKRILCK